MDKNALIDAICNLSLMEAADIVKALEEKLGVSAAAPMAVAAAPTGGAPAEAAVEKDTFDVELTSAGSNKIGVIKVVRTVTTLGLKEAKDLVDGAPQMIKEGATKAEAEEIKAKFADSGATITLK